MIVVVGVDKWDVVVNLRIKHIAYWQDIERTDDMRQATPRLIVPHRKGYHTDDRRDVDLKDADDFTWRMKIRSSTMKRRSRKSVRYSVLQRPWRIDSRRLSRERSPRCTRRRIRIYAGEANERLRRKFFGSRRLADS